MATDTAAILPTVAASERTGQHDGLRGASSRERAVAPTVVA